MESLFGMFIIILILVEALAQIVGFKTSPSKTLIRWIFRLIVSMLRGIVRGAIEGIFGKPKKKRSRRHDGRGHDDDGDED